ncbi:putative arabinosyltransferase ARAD1 [Cocos nucifera]|uniref:Putative arabinosyltransferase ARAD1 n=1 Tax=Cocos nucifera TaxID=13894 RepID=A0A8K0NAI6_COCNU|nr:putative arabinosyltransferase ARAD1 [Cocos nucifera]
MANRNTQTHGLVSRKFLCCWLFLVIVLVLYCIFSWDSTTPPAPIDHSLFPNQKAFSLFENQSLLPLRDDLPLNQETYSLDPPKDQELKKCDPSKALLKVFLYDMPPEFHFGLLDWVADGKSVWPDIRTKIPSYPGGLNLQHSIEYWLTLDLLSSRFPDRSGPCTAVRVEDSREADVVFVPFFSSLSYNRHSKIKPPEKVSRNKMLQQKLVMYLTAQEEWKRSGGKDHIIMAHHPNSMLDARTKLWPCMFILADFGRYIPHVANVEKDIIAPYKHVIKTFVNDTSTYDDRPTLLYFQGAIYRKDVSSFPVSLV